MSSGSPRNFHRGVPRGREVRLCSRKAVRSSRFVRTTRESPSVAYMFRDTYVPDTNCTTKGTYWA